MGHLDHEGHEGGQKSPLALLALNKRTSQEPHSLRLNGHNGDQQFKNPFKLNINLNSQDYTDDIKEYK